ncbi:CPBP family intramembrane glutamic endopeptidase [Tsuneonella troitsensis]|uniref:CPBP family intramembrane glutamic endopeptidase n=1 Tax=Tsuneonella troitsensis TaxID=292222 RepID=UPI000710B830|nr:CPBP family intramembrane glutamic endopeptidase [Tsuneonella troitsensis]
MTDQSLPLPSGKIAAALTAQALVFVVAGAAMWVFAGNDLAEFVDLGWLPVGQGVLLGLALIAVVGATFKAFPRFLEHTVHLQSKMAVLFSERTGWREYVIIALCAGIGEEAIFRGGLMTLLDGYTGPAAAIFLSSLVFALFHLAKPLIGAIILVVGVIMGLVYWWTGSLLTVMIGHALYDVWALRRLHLEFIRLGYAPVTDDAV